MKADLQPTTPGVDRPASYVARILVVDDEKSIRTTLGAILRSEGHQVRSPGMWRRRRRCWRRATGTWW
jgi:DNA-binding NtrC family response regulator